MDDVRREVQVSIVLMPNQVIAVRVRNNIGVSVPVNIGRQEAVRTNRRDSGGPDTQPAGAIVFVPRDLKVGSAEGVKVAITIKVDHDRATDTNRGCRDCSFGEVLLTVVFLPSDLVFVE